MYYLHLISNLIHYIGRGVRLVDLLDKGVLGVAIVILIAFMLAIISPGGNDLIGKWSDNNDTLTFTSETVKSSYYFGLATESEYTYKNGVLMIQVPLVGKEYFDVSISGEVLILSNQNSNQKLKFQRQG